MFNESYYIFSVGNIKPIWTEEFPSCWKARALTCSHHDELKIVSSDSGCYIPGGSSGDQHIHVIAY